MLTLSVPLSARRDSNRIFLPSGDQSGAKLSALFAESLVKGIKPDPSAFTTQIFVVAFVLVASLPSKARLDSNTILLPSGDQLAKRLSALAAVVLVTGIWLEPSAFITQMFSVLFVFTALVPSSARFDWKTIFLLSGDQL